MASIIRNIVLQIAADASGAVGGVRKTIDSLNQLEGTVGNLSQKLGSLDDNIDSQGLQDLVRSERSLANALNQRANALSRLAQAQNSVNRAESQSNSRKPFVPQNVTVNKMDYNAPVSDVINKLGLGKITNAQLAALSSAANNSQVNVTASNSGGPNFDRPQLEIVGGNDYLTANRKIFKDAQGKLVIDNAYIDLDKKARDKADELVTGLDLFINQVLAAKQLGIDKLVTTAARGEESNGYYTWARFGYTGQIPDKTFSNLPESFRQQLGDKRNIGDLLDLPGGADAWKKFGDTVDLEFDLTRGSENLKRLKKYLNEKLEVEKFAEKMEGIRASLNAQREGEEARLRDLKLISSVRKRVEAEEKFLQETEDFKKFGEKWQDTRASLTKQRISEDSRLGGKENAFRTELAKAQQAGERFKVFRMRFAKALTGGFRGPNDDPSKAADAGFGANAFNATSRGFLSAGRSGTNLVGGAVGRLKNEAISFTNQLFANLTARTLAYVKQTGVELVAMAFELAAKYEDALISFGVLTGSQSRGSELVSSLQKLAVETPFKSSELLDQAKLLISYGVEVNDIEKRLRSLGDVASGTGADIGRLSLAFGQVVAKGRLQGTEIRQFTEAGVGIREFVDAYNELEGKNVRTTGFLSLVESGVVSAAVVERAFEKMTGAGGRFFGFMEQRSRTVSGRLSAFIESLELGAQRVGKSVFDKLNVGGGLDFLVKQLQGLNFSGVDSALGNIGPEIQRFAAGLFGGLQGTLRNFVTTVFGDVDSKSFGALFDKFTNSVVPGIIDFGVLIARAFAGVAQAAIGLAGVIQAVAAKLAGGSGTGLGSVVGALAGGYGGLKLGLAGGAALTATGVATGGVGLALLALLAGGGALAGGKIGSNLLGGLIDGSSAKNGDDSALGTSGKILADLQDRLFKLEGGGAFGGGSNTFLSSQQVGLKRKALEGENDALQEKLSLLRLVDLYDQKFLAGQRPALDTSPAGLDFSRRVADARRRLADLGIQLDNSSVDNRRVSNEKIQSDLAKQLQKQQEEAQRLRVTEAFRSVFSKKPPKSDNEILADKLNRDSINTFGTSANLSGKDVEFGKNALGKLNDAFGTLQKTFYEIADNAIPRFRKNMEEVFADINKPEFNPYQDFLDKANTIEFLSSPLAQLLGVGITGAQAERAFGELGQSYVKEYAKETELKPAPLIAAGTQEAARAMTQAIYAATNANRKPEDSLREAIEKAKKVTETNNENLKALADETKKLVTEYQGNKNPMPGPWLPPLPAKKNS